MLQHQYSAKLIDSCFLPSLVISVLQLEKWFIYVCIITAIVPFSSVNLVFDFCLSHLLFVHLFLLSCIISVHQVFFNYFFYVLHSLFGYIQYTSSIFIISFRNTPLIHKQCKKFTIIFFRSSPSCPVCICHMSAHGPFVHLKSSSIRSSNQYHITLTLCFCFTSFLSLTLWGHS